MNHNVVGFPNQVQQSKRNFWKGARAPLVEHRDESMGRDRGSGAYVLFSLDLN